MADQTSEASERVAQPVQMPADLSPRDSVAASLRGFGPVGILAILIVLFTGNLWLGHVVLPVGGLLALLWVRLSRTPWCEIGYVRPKSWLSAILVGTIFG